MAEIIAAVSFDALAKLSAWAAAFLAIGFLIVHTATKGHPTRRLIGFAVVAVAVAAAFVWGLGKAAGSW
jgi:hypothetical protein